MNADPEVMRYFPALLSAEQTNAGVDIWCQQLAEKGWSNWAVDLLESGEFIGFIGLSVPRRPLPFEEIVSFTALANLPSIAVMQRIGMRNAQADFERPAVPDGSPLRPHCLYRIGRAQWQAGDANLSAAQHA